MGLSIKGESLNKFKLVPGIKAKQVACGWSHTILLTEDGRVLVTGDNKRGQLGLGIEIADSSFFYHVNTINEPVKQVACGVWSSFVVLQTGKVLFWGQFRNIKSEICWIPTELDEMGNASKISVGHKHVLTLSESAKVSGFGCNKFGQINFQDQSALDIFAGWNHSILQLDTKSILLIGKNDHNQLAHHDKSIKSNFIRLENENIVDIAVGSDHCLLLTDRRLLVWGWNEHGILGNNHMNQIYGPPKELYFDISRIKNMFCGPVSCFIITKANE